MWKLDEHGSGQYGNLMSMGVASYQYAAPQVVRCCPAVALEHGSGQLVALEHGSEVEIEFVTG